MSGRLAAGRLGLGAADTQGRFIMDAAAASCTKPADDICCVPMLTSSAAPRESVQSRCSKYLFIGDSRACHFFQRALPCL